MLLVNAQGGNIDARRVATMSPQTYREIRRIIEQQKNQPFNPETYHHSLQETMNRLTPANIARNAGRIETLGQEVAPKSA